MTGIEIGTVCYKLKGRRAGRKVVVVGFDKHSGMLIVEGEAKRARKCNAQHLWPIEEKVKVLKKVDSVEKPVVEHKKRQEKKAVARPKAKIEKKKPVHKREEKEHSHGKKVEKKAEHKHKDKKEKAKKKGR